MNFENVVRMVVVTASAVFALAGCAADAESPSPATTRPTVVEPADENVAAAAEALKAGGGGGLGFNCGLLGCICNGDADCNDMFSGGACGSMPAKCYERGPSQYCICAPWVGKTAAVSSASGGPASGGVLAP